MEDMENPPTYNIVNAFNGAVVMTGLKSVGEAATRIRHAKFHDPEVGAQLVIRRAEEEDE